MMIRDYIQPQPAVPADNGVGDRVTPDLAELASAVRDVGGAPAWGIHG
jgi:hypothetical protein